MRLARDVPVTDHVDGLALDRALETLNDAHRRIAADALAAGGGKAETLGPWLSTRQAEAGRVIDTLASLLGGKTISVSRVTVAAGLLADLARAMH
jgi:glutamate dehydrogenase